MIKFLIFFIVLGIIISKPFRAGIGTTIGAILVFTPVIVLGTPYGLLFHAPIMSYRARSIKVYFMYLHRFIDGIYAFLGDIMKYGFAYRYDELGNVAGGELLEDLIGQAEQTPLGEKSITLSASIGWYEKSKHPMNIFGTSLSKALNKVFRQTRHAKGSWELKLELDRIKKLNLHGNID